MGISLLIPECLTPIVNSPPKCYISISSSLIEINENDIVIPFSLSIELLKSN